MHQWVPRVLLAAVVATAAAIVPIFEAARVRDQFRLEFDVTSPTPGTLAVSGDSGFSTVALGSFAIGPSAPGGPASRAVVPLRPGRYVRWRIAVSPESRISLSDAKVVDGRGGREYPLTTSETDAHIELVPERAAALFLDEDERRWTAIVWTLVFAAALAVWRLVDRSPRARREPALVGWCRRHPAAAVVATAVVATSASTYPLLAGRSLVTPGNGPAAFLYDRPPFGYGFRDLTAEDVRGPDVGAMMWVVLPYRVVQAEALRHAEFPWWNRYNHLGLPLWAQGQSFFLDPLHLASLAWTDVAAGADAKYVLHRFVFSAGVGMAALAATGCWWAALLVAGATVFNGQFVSWLNHPAYFSLTYAPWILYGYFVLANARTSAARARGGTIAAVAGALLVYASPPKEALSMALTVHLAGITSVAVAAARNGTWSKLAVALTAGASAVLLSSLHWLVFLDNLTRSATIYDVPDALFADATALTTFVLGPWSSRHVSASVSPFISVFAIVGLLGPGRWPPAIVGASVGTATAIVIATGVAGDVLMTLPLVSRMHRVGEIVLNAASVPMLVVSAWGLRQAYTHPLLRVSSAGGWLRVAILSGAVAAAGMLVVATGDYTSPYIGLSIVSVVAAFSLPFLLGALADGWRRVPAAGFAFLVALLLAPGGLHFDTGIAALDRRLVQPRPRERLERASPTIERLKQHAEPFRVAPAANVMYGGVHGYFGLEGVTGGDAVWTRGLSDLAGRFAANRYPWSFLSSGSEAELQRMNGLLDMLNVRFVLAADPSASPADPMRAIERPTAWPRAFFVDRVELVADGRTLASRTTAGPAGPFATIRGGNSGMSDRSLIGTASVAIPASTYRLTPNTTTFTIKAPSAGVAVLSETYLPHDFVAELNGQPATYFEVNQVMRAVVIPGAGEWTIEYRYRPARLTLSLWMMGGGVIAVGALWLMPVAARRRRHPLPPS